MAGEPMSTQMTAPELRELFLFAELDDEQIAWIQAHADVVEFGANEVICREGEPARCFWVLLGGEFAMLQTIRGAEVETTRSAQRGTYGGSTTSYSPEAATEPYKHTLRTVTPSSFLALPAAEWATALRTWFPLA